MICDCGSGEACSVLEGTVAFVVGHLMHDPHAAPERFEANIARARRPIIVTAPSAASDTTRSWTMMLMGTPPPLLRSVRPSRRRTPAPTYTPAALPRTRSEERRVGKECRCRG